MRLSPQQYAEALHRALLEVSESQHDAVLGRFAAALAEAGDLGAYPDIERELALLLSGKQAATVTVSGGGEVSGEVMDGLNRIANAQLSPEVRRDPNALGGIVLRTGDLLLDASLKRQIEDLKNQMAR